MYDYVRLRMITNDYVVFWWIEPSSMCIFILSFVIFFSLASTLSHNNMVILAFLDIIFLLYTIWLEIWSPHLAVADGVGNGILFSSLVLS